MKLSHIADTEKKNTFFTTTLTKRSNVSFLDGI